MTLTPEQHAEALRDAAWVVKSFEDAGVHTQPSSQYRQAKALLATTAKLRDISLIINALQHARGMPYTDMVRKIDQVIDEMENGIQRSPALLEQSFPTVAKKVRKRNPIKRRSSAYLQHKKSVFERDGGKCQYCGDCVGIKGTLDHVVPVAKGGSGDTSNLVWACHPCNTAKGRSNPVGKWEPRAMKGSKR